MYFVISEEKTRQGSCLHLSVERAHERRGFGLGGVRSVPTNRDYGRRHLVQVKLTLTWDVKF